MKGLLIALQFLTRIPGPRMDVSGEEFAASIRWFPAVGLIVGALVAGAVYAGAMADPWVGALAGLSMWVGVTGALHLDGLGDVADAAGAGHKDRGRMLAALSDPHAGSFAVVTITLQLIAKLVLLHGIAARGLFLPLILIPFAARIAPLIWTRALPPLHDGLGARFRHAVGNAALLIWIGALLLAAWFIPALAATIPFIVLWIIWIRRTLGGISGDGHGAGMEVAESILLLALLLSTGGEGG